MNQNVQNEINNIINEINKNINVNKIYLFGSYAYGNPNEKSDLDLCILTKDTTIRKRELMKQIRKAIYKSSNIPVDALLYDNNEFFNRAMIESSIEHKIFSEGISLYEQ